MSTYSTRGWFVFEVEFQLVQSDSGLTCGGGGGVSGSLKPSGRVRVGDLTSSWVKSKGSRLLTGS